MARPLKWVKGHWLPFDEAFVRLKDYLDGRDIALHELHEALLSGKIQAAQWTKKAGWEVLNPDFWQHTKLRESEKSPGHVVFHRFASARVYGQVDLAISVRRRDFNKMMPTRIGSDNVLPLRGPGRPLVYDWVGITVEAARQCIDRNGCVDVPKNASHLARILIEWYNEKHGVQSPESTVREVVSRVCAALRGTQK